MKACLQVDVAASGQMEQNCGSNPASQWHGGYLNTVSVSGSGSRLNGIGNGSVLGSKLQFCHLIEV